MALPVMCEHENALEWTPCQRCGRPVCGICTAASLELPSLPGISLPLKLCGPCVESIRALTKVAAAPVAHLRCPAHEELGSDGKGCQLCQATQAAASRRNALMALDKLQRERFFGDGGRRTNAGREVKSLRPQVKCQS
jgi:hypothetical protein